MGEYRPSQMWSLIGVGVQRKGRFRMSQNTGECFGIHTTGQRMGGEGV